VTLLPAKLSRIGWLKVKKKRRHGWTKAMLPRRLPCHLSRLLALSHRSKV
jgi:hypothetical protein